MIIASIISAVAAATMTLAPADPTPPPPIEGVVMGKWYESATPEGILRLPTGPECNVLMIADTSRSFVFNTKVCVTREVWDQNHFYSYYRGN